MLIYIDKTILDLLKSEHKDTDMDRISAALAQIVDGRKNGRHIVYGTRRTLQELMMYFFTNEGEKSTKYVVFKKIYENYTITSSLFKLIKCIFYVNVVWNDTDYNKISNNSLTINVKNCPNETFDFFLNKTILLLENNDDAEYYYKPITFKYLDSHKTNRKFIDYIPMQTGGSAVEQASKENILSMNNFCFGLTDSDERFGTIPSSGISFSIPPYATRLKFEKLKQLLKNEKNIDNFLYDCYVLKVRDVENLISLNMLKPYFHNTEKIFDLIKLIQTEDKKENAFYQYFDFENGINKKDNNEIKFWSEILNVVQCDLPDSGICSKEQIKEFCNYDIINSCNTKELPKLLQKEWEKIGQLVFSRCCAYKDNKIKNS